MTTLRNEPIVVPNRKTTIRKKTSMGNGKFSMITVAGEVQHTPHT